jgi:NIMA (never in mitosis gene a)-related kinase 2
MKSCRRLVCSTEPKSYVSSYTCLTPVPGQGSFGIIRKVRRKQDSAILCRKEISYSRMSEKEKAQLAAELDILRNLRHPNIVQYYTREHIKQSQDIHMYMEYCGNGDLGGYIKTLKDQGRYADEDFVWGVFAQLVSALYRCHYGEDAPAPGDEGKARKGKVLQTKEGHRVILHRDLKPENGKLNFWLHFNHGRKSSEMAVRQARGRNGHVLTTHHSA